MKKQSALDLLSAPMCTEEEVEKVASAGEASVVQDVISIFNSAYTDEACEVPFDVGKITLKPPPIRINSVTARPVQLRPSAQAFVPSASAHVQAPESQGGKDELGLRHYAAALKLDRQTSSPKSAQSSGSLYNAAAATATLKAANPAAMEELCAQSHRRPILRRIRSASACPSAQPTATAAVTTTAITTTPDSAAPPRLDLGGDLFSHASDAAIQNHRKRWEALAARHAKSAKEEQEKREKLQQQPPPVAGGAVTEAGPAVGLFIDDSDDEEESAQDLLAENSVSSTTDVLTPFEAPEQTGRRWRSRSESTCRTEAEEAELVERWWRAIAAGDSKDLQLMTTVEGAAYLRDWHSRKYTASGRGSDPPASAAAVGLSEDFVGMLSLHIVAALGDEKSLEAIVNSYPSNCNIDTRDRRMKRTAVLYAACASSLACVKVLFAAGASLSSSDRSGENILHKAAKADNIELVQWLCQASARNGIKVNLRSKKLNTPLLLSRSRRVAQVLIAAGADPTARNLDEMDISCHAAIRNDDELLEQVLLANTAFLRNYPANAAKAHAQPPTHLDLRTHADTAASINSKYFGNGTANGKESAAVHYQDVTAIRMRSPLHLAVLHDSRRCIRTMCNLFKSAYASVGMLNEVDNIRSVIARDQLTISSIDYFDESTGWTPLHLACVFGKRSVVEELLLHGACPTLEDKQGANAVTLAAFFGHTQIVPSLEGAEYVNRRGETALDVYLKLKLLQPKGAALKALLPPPGIKSAIMRADSSDAAKVLTQQRELSLLQMFAEDDNFMELALAGAQISMSLLQKISSYDSEDVNRRVVQASQVRPSAPPVADLQERTHFMQQDRKNCDVVCVCRDDAQDDLPSCVPASIYFNHDDEEPLVLKGKRFIFAHKRVLVAHSGKFESMIRFVEQQLTSKGGEKEVAGGCLVLHLDDLDYTRGCQMLYFMYTSRLVPDAWKRVEWPLPERSPMAAGGRSRSGSAPCDDIEVEPEDFGEGVVWLLNLLPVADEYIMKSLFVVVKDALVRKVEAAPACTAPLVFVNTLGLYDKDGAEIGIVSARQILLHSSASFASFKMEARSARQLLELCLTAMIVSPSPSPPPPTM